MGGIGVAAQVVGLGDLGQSQTGLGFRKERTQPKRRDRLLRGATGGEKEAKAEGFHGVFSLSMSPGSRASARSIAWRT